MKKYLLSILLITLVTIIFLTIPGCNYLESRLPILKKQLTPVELYHKAWTIIKNEYYDPSRTGDEWNYWEHRYDDVLLTNDDAYIAIQTMIESLNDRYTRLLTPDKFAEQDIDIEAKISGIGIQIAQKDDKIIVVSVLEDTPAYSVGLKSNDIITQVDQTSTKGLDLKDVADLIRGEIGTYVNLVISRNNKKQLFRVKRDEIRIKALTQEMLDDNISYIRLSSFISQNAGAEMEEAILNANSADAYIIDLRNNHGGLLPNAISIANIFIDRGAIIVSIVDKKGRKQDYHSVVKSLTDKPLVILINGASASASEILSGALKDHHRAILVGEKTFGKGMVQKIFDLPDGSGLNVTVSKYLTPNGTDIDHVGIIPDIEVEMTIDDFKNNKDLQLEIAKNIAKKAIKEKKQLSKK
ncbi:MAG: S41 family peptidase [Cyanobacteriota bacterium]